MRISPALLILLSTSLQADPAAWQVGGRDGQIWLLGSVHYLREQDYPLPPIVDELYGLADTLVMELDLDDLDPAAIQGSFATAGVLPPNTTLRSILDPETYSRTEALAADLGMPMTLLERLEPWLVSLTLTDLTMARLGFQANHGLEQYLMRNAVADRKEILGLESIEDQAILLSQSVEDLATPEEFMFGILDAWRAGSLDELAEEFSDDFADSPELERALVATRNARWVARIDEMLDDGRRYLIVVGALHLVGDDSVVAMLQARGVEVSPVQ
jgi:uncharacterized protein YbaP (TraB family)